MACKQDSLDSMVRRTIHLNTQVLDPLTQQSCADFGVVNSIGGYNSFAHYMYSISEIAM